MIIDSGQGGDALAAVAGYARPVRSAAELRGRLHVVLVDEHGEVKLDEVVENLITQLGDQYYMERAAGIASPPGAVTGMQLGTGTTAPAKTGAGAAIVTLVANSLVALSATPASSLTADATPRRQIRYVAAWAAGIATANAISEVALVNQATGTQTAAPAGSTIARALLSPTVNKAAGDTLTVTWDQTFVGT